MKNLSSLVLVLKYEKKANKGFHCDSRGLRSFQISNRKYQNLCFLPNSG